jgi:proteasome lid subunit RPN8/RPN11
VIRCANAHPTPVSRYAIDPVEQIRAFRDMEGRGEELVAIYHSHPITQPYPSPTDRSEWHYPDAYLLLLSLRDIVPEIRVYRVRDGWVREAELA